MKKVIVFVALSFFIMVIHLSYGEEVAVYQEVYYDNEEGVNHYKSITEALAHVKEEGTIYVGMPINISKLGDTSIRIKKSVTIKGVGDQGNKVLIKHRDIGPVFKLEDVGVFQLENLEISGYDNEVVRGVADHITIKNCKFFTCRPINTTTSKLKGLLFESNEVIGGNVYIQPSVYGAQVVIRNSTFDVRDGRIHGFILENCNMMVESNYFNGYSFIVENGEGADGLIRCNTFDRDGRRIMIKEDQQNLRFENNRIYKNKGEVYYRGNGTISFTRNWWGTREGPNKEIFDGDIDAGNWALFEDFRRYKEDPYHERDLQIAYSILGLDVDEDNWIYDLTRDGIVDFVDVIGIIRKIKE